MEKEAWLTGYSNFSCSISWWKKQSQSNLVCVLWICTLKNKANKL